MIKTDPRSIIENIFILRWNINFFQNNFWRYYRCMFTVNTYLVVCHSDTLKCVEGGDIPLIQKCVTGTWQCVSLVHKMWPWYTKNVSPWHSCVPVKHQCVTKTHPCFTACPCETPNVSPWHIYHCWCVTVTHHVSVWHMLCHGDISVCQGETYSVYIVLSVASILKGEPTPYFWEFR